MKILTVVFIMVLMAGCSTAPIALQDTQRMPSTHILKYSAPSPSTGHIIVYRDAGSVGSPCQPDIYINGEDVADSLPSGGRVDLFPPAGTLHLHAGQAISNFSSYLV